MTDNGQFDGYTNLRTLTVFMDSFNMSPGPWYMLVPFLERGPPSRMIQKLTIDVRIEFPTDLSAAVDWAVLDRINDMLEDTKFDALRDLEFIVQLKEELGWDPQEEAEALLARVEDRLYNMVGPEKRVVTRYWRVDEVRARSYYYLRGASASCLLSLRLTDLCLTVLRYNHQHEARCTLTHAHLWCGKLTLRLICITYRDARANAEN